MQSQTMSRRDPSRDAAHISHEQGHRQILVHNRQEGIHRGDHRTNNIILQIKNVQNYTQFKMESYFMIAMA